MYDNLEIIKFDHEGRGIGYLNGKTIFVDNTIPGDIVNISIKKNKKNYSVATVLKFIKYSPNRIKPECPFFHKCGGCDLQNINYIDQLKFKEEKIKEILEKFAKINKNKVKSILSDKKNQFYYRNKLTLQVDKKIGLYGKNSYELVPVNKCLISSKKINEILNIIYENINLENIGQIVIRNSFYNNKVMIIFKGKNININNVMKLKKIVDSIYVDENNNYRLVYGLEYLEEKIGDYIFKISPDSFFQVNTVMCKKLYDKIIEYGSFNGTQNVLDLYCGTGTIGIYISKYVKSVVGYEINKYAVMNAQDNLKINAVYNANFYCGSSELSFENITNNIDVIIVDPPRGGLNLETIQGIINVKPCKVIYVSCDPVTLARDLQILSDYYDVIEVTPVDMFPNTKHVECVAVLKLK